MAAEKKASRPTRCGARSALAASLASLMCVAFGCSDANMASLSAIGSPAEIVCYSGGREVYHGRSTGRISTVSNSDGWEFKEAESGDFLRVSGDCVIRN